MIYELQGETYNDTKKSDHNKHKTRNCNDCITPFYDIIAELLSDRNQQVFYYRKVLW